ncbi:MAG: multicopper oxidase domain-containing protein [Steroidobacteraceae bacterium]|nr:multicopper oxidase domain-containing protein [Deltaproteobacteria bacterium]
MKKIILALVIAAATMALSGCCHHHRGMHVRDAGDRVKAADWSKMETATVTMTDFAFSPANIVFRQGIPYKLVIENKGTQKHYFTAEGFFRAIATRKLQSNSDGEVKAPYFSAIEVYPGRTLDLYFIPVTKGSYHLVCTIEGHTEMGMKGEISIE